MTRRSVGTRQSRLNPTACVPGGTSATIITDDSSDAGMPALAAASAYSAGGGPGAVLPWEMPSMTTSTSGGTVTMASVADTRSSERVTSAGLSATAWTVWLTAR